MESIRITAVVSGTVGTEIDDYCHSRRITKSKFVGELISKWRFERQRAKTLGKDINDLTDEEYRKYHGMATDEELREAVDAGIVTAGEVGLK